MAGPRGNHLKKEVVRAGVPLQGAHQAAEEGIFFRAVIAVKSQYHGKETDRHMTGYGSEHYGSFLFMMDQWIFVKMFKAEALVSFHFQAWLMKGIILRAALPRKT